MRLGAGHMDFSEEVGGGRAETGKEDRQGKSCAFTWSRTTGGIGKTNTKILDLVFTM